MDDSVVLRTAQQELSRGVAQMLGSTLRVETPSSREPAIILGTVTQVHATAPHLHPPKDLRADGYRLKSVKISRIGIYDRCRSQRSRRALRRLRPAEQNRPSANLDSIDETQQPSAPVRWVNQWDNLDGTIERGYGGRSIFFDDGNVRSRPHARERLRPPAGFGRHQRLRDQQRQRNLRVSKPISSRNSRASPNFRAWGVRLAIAVDVSIPSDGRPRHVRSAGSRVAEWWREQVRRGLREIPDFGGVVVKADSEGRLGPRLMAALPPMRRMRLRAHSSRTAASFSTGHLSTTIIWTGANLKNDRAKAAYDNFHPLDGQFDDNVIIQIKHGPIDFQVREPVSPLFGGL